jgi:hypothetical protein
MQRFADAMQNWHAGDHSNKWMQSMKEAHAKDPEAFKGRGRTKPEHHFEGVKLGDQPEHVQRHMASMPATSPTEASATSKVAEPKAAPAGIDMSKLPAELRAKFSGGK